MRPTSTDMLSGLKLALFFVAGALMTFYLVDYVGNDRIASRLTELCFVALSLLVTSLWAVWQAQESIADVSILSHLSRSQNTKLQFKRSYTRDRVKGSIYIAIFSGIFAMIGDSLLPKGIFFLFIGGITTLLFILFTQHLLSYFSYSNQKAKYQERIAKIEKIEKNEDRFNR